MSLFSSILDELSKKLQKGEQYKKEISKDIEEIIGATVLPDQIIIKNKTLFISVSPTIKTVILLKKQKLLEQLKQYNIKSIG